MKTAIFTEENYKEMMDGTVAPWWKKHVARKQILSFDGTKLMTWSAVNPLSEKAIVMVHGFTEYTEKFAEVMYYFYQEGYSVFMYDQRGHGRSGRKIHSEDLVYVVSFDEYVEDLHFFIENVVKKEAPNLPLILFGHSMGGCISALFLEKYPDVFSAAVLTSPMLKMYFGGLPDAAVNILSNVSKVLRWRDRPAPGAAPFNPEPDFENTCATSRARYLYHLRQAAAHRAYHTCGATYAWVRAAMDATEEVLQNAARVKIPLLICQAGNDQLVDNEGQDIFASSAEHASIVRFPEAKHEIYRSQVDILKTYYDTVLGFFAEA